MHGEPTGTHRTAWPLGEDNGNGDHHICSAQRHSNGHEDPRIDVQYLFVRSNKRRTTYANGTQSNGYAEPQRRLAIGQRSRLEVQAHNCELLYRAGSCVKCTSGCEARETSLDRLSGRSSQSKVPVVRTDHRIASDPTLAQQRQGRAQPRCRVEIWSMDTTLPSPFPSLHYQQLSSYPTIKKCQSQ